MRLSDVAYGRMALAALTSNLTTGSHVEINGFGEGTWDLAVQPKPHSPLCQTQLRPRESKWLDPGGRAQQGTEASLSSRGWTPFPSQAYLRVAIWAPDPWTLSVHPHAALRVQEAVRAWSLAGRLESATQQVPFLKRKANRSWVLMQGVLPHGSLQRLRARSSRQEAPDKRLATVQSPCRLSRKPQGMQHPALEKLPQAVQDPEDV